MSQNSLIIGNVASSAARTAMNNAFNTIKTLQSGATAPGATEAFMLWMDTSTSLLKIRDNSNASWITIGYLDDANNDFHPVVGNWEIKHSGEDMIFSHSGTNRMKLTSTGNLTVTGDITAFGSV